jgi:hypothetical protein
MKSCCGDVRDIEEGGQVGPKGRNKLGTAVRSNGMGNAKAGNPNRAECISTGTSRGGRKRNSLNPASGPVNDGENVGVALRGRKGANEVNMDMGETPGGERNSCGRGRNVFVDFVSLARNTLSGPEVDVPSHTVPEETRSEESTSGSDTRVT